MPSAKPLSKDKILLAQSKTRSNRAAAKYLRVSYPHYKRYAKMYEATKEGYDNLFDQHLNPSGKGIPKFLSNKGKEPALLDIIEGKIDASHFSPQKIKHRLIAEGYLQEECAVCGFCERRVLDFRVPLLLHFKDNNKNNYLLENIDLLCYNHYFLTVGDIFNKKDEMQIESGMEHFNTTENVEWEVDDYHLQRLKELGLADDEPDEGDEFIANL